MDHKLPRRPLGCLAFLDEVAWGRWLLLADRLEELDPDYSVLDYGFKWEYLYLYVSTKSDQAARLVERFERQVNAATDRENERRRTLERAVEQARAASGARSSRVSGAQPAARAADVSRAAR